MYQYYCLNAISRAGLDVFDEKYESGSPVDFAGKRAW